MWKCNSIIILNILILLPKIVVSDDTHYKDMLFGGRAAGMGGTYIAISDDKLGVFTILLELFTPTKIVFQVAVTLFFHRSTI